MVFIVMSDYQILSVCGNKESAEHDKELFELNGHKNIYIDQRSIVTYEKYKEE